MAYIIIPELHFTCTYAYVQRKTGKKRARNEEIEMQLITRKKENTM